jgi:hypothetical protein
MHKVPSCYYFDGVKPVGPFEVTGLVDLLGRRKLTRETPVWYEGLPDWVPLGSVLPPTESVSISTQGRRSGRLYTLNQTGPICLKEVHVKKATPRAVMLDDFTVLPDGSRRKVLVRGADDLPETPIKAMEQYVEAQKKRVEDAQALAKKEISKLEKAEEMLAALREGKEVPIAAYESPTG